MAILVGFELMILFCLTLACSAGVAFLFLGAVVRLTTRPKYNEPEGSSGGLLSRRALETAFLRAHRP